MKSLVRYCLMSCLVASPALAQRDNDSTAKESGFDLSSHLLKKGGFLPIPIIITEPAIGVGGGVALVFFGKPAKQDKKKEGHTPLPALTGVGGFIAGRGAYGVGVAAYRPLYGDRVRYFGSLGATRLKLKFFGFQPGAPLTDNPAHYVFDGYGTLQRVQVRVADTRFYGGVHYVFLHSKSTFDDSPLPFEVPPSQLRTNVGGLGPGVEYDTRDNSLDARRGMDLMSTLTWYGRALGGSTSFGKFKATGLFYGQPSSRIGFGARVEAKSAWGDIPFFDMPYISMRGISAQQFSNRVIVLEELEGRYGFTERWTGVAFGGAGRAAPSWRHLGDGEVRGAGGVGFRYLLARKLGLRSGLDVAVGPGGDVAVYLQNGAAWR